MKVALVWPATPFLIDPFVHPPLGLWYLWSVLERAGHEVEYFDLNADPIPTGFDAYLVSGTTPQAGEIKKLAKLLDGRKIVGGPHATLFPEQMLEWGYDTVVVGEGEEWINAVLADAHCRIIKTPRIGTRQSLMSIDDIPFPNRSQAHRYHFNVGGRDATTMFTSRGCPFHCAFCCHAIWGQQCVQRSAENVYEEVAQLYDMGYRAVMFFDDTFTLNKKRLYRICELLKPLDLYWRCFIRADTVDLPMLEAMKDAGCVEVGIGIESGSQKILDIINKGTTVEQNTQVVQWCKQVGIAAKCFLILGLPGEDKQTIEGTRRWILENRPDKMDLVFYVPYPKTPITLHPEKYDIHFQYNDFTECIYKTHPDAFKPLTWTSGITRKELYEARQKILKEAGIGY